MRAVLLILLIMAPTVAFAAEDGGARFSEVALWGLLLTLLVALGLAAARARGWVDHYVTPMLRAFERVAVPPRTRSWVPGGAVPPSLFGESWLKLGGVHWVREIGAEAIPKVISDLLESPHVVAAVHARLAEVSLDQVFEEQVARVEGRLFVCQDPPAEATFATLSLRGSPVVLVMDHPPDADQLATVQRWGAILIVVSPDEPSVPGLIGVRRAP